VIEKSVDDKSEEWANEFAMKNQETLPNSQVLKIIVNIYVLFTSQL
jgi:hypothetical protein